MLRRYPPTLEELKPLLYKEKGQLWEVRRKCVSPWFRAARYRKVLRVRLTRISWLCRRRREAKGKFQTRKGSGKRASLRK